MAYTKRNSKNGWALFLLILAGIVIGSLLGVLTAPIPFLKWLGSGYKFTIGSESEILDLKIITLMFRMEFNITIASILGIAAGVFAYRKI